MRRWFVWLAMAMIVGASLLVAGVGDRSPQTEAERIDAVSSVVRCPTCRGQSVRESNAPAAQAIRAEIARRVRAGEGDEAIRAYLVSRYGEKVLLNPPQSGAGALVWAIPAAAAVIAAAGLAAAFWKWRNSPSLNEPSPEASLSDESSATGSGSVTGLSQRRLRTAGVIAVVGLLAVGAGIAAAVSSGTRRPGEVATGGSVNKQAERMQQAVKLANDDKQLEALKLYDAILADEPDHVAALTERGLLLALVGRSAERNGLIEQGRSSLDEALALRPNDPRALFYRGLVLRFLGDDPSALDSFRAALNANPPPALRASIEGFLSTAGIGDPSAPAPAPAPTPTP